MTNDRFLGPRHRGLTINFKKNHIANILPGLAGGSEGRSQFQSTTETA